MTDRPSVYISGVRIERKEGPDRLAWMPAEQEPVHFGVHGAMAEFYGRKDHEIPAPHATTLDCIVAATGG
jgi:hypothetical protein